MFNIMYRADQKSLLPKTQSLELDVWLKTFSFPHKFTVQTLENPRQSGNEN